MGVSRNGIVLIGKTIIKHEILGYYFQTNASDSCLLYSPTSDLNIEVDLPHIEHMSSEEQCSNVGQQNSQWLLYPSSTED